MDRHLLFRIWVFITAVYWVSAFLYDAFVLKFQFGQHSSISAGLGIIVAVGLPAFVLVIGLLAFWIAGRLRGRKNVNM
jgi:hypothetical protein